MAFEAPDSAFETRVRASFNRQRFMHLLGVEIASLGPGSCELRLAYRAELGQQHGFFHGGIVGTLADNAAGYASYTLMPADASILTVEYKLNLLSPAAGAVLISRARVLKPGRTLTVTRSDVFAADDGAEKHVATALVTLMALPGRPDEPTPR